MKYIKADWPAPPHIKAYTTCRTSWQNRQNDFGQLQSLLGIPTEPVWLQQVHGSKIVAAVPENQNKMADASYSRTPNQVCIVTTADCLPVLLCDRNGEQVAAIHAGWRGLAEGVLETAIEQLNVPTLELLAWFGPAISQSKFEVGEDVFCAFEKKLNNLEQAFIRHQVNKWQADLYQIARLILMRLGVQNIYGGNYCTYSQPELFFSYRRDNNETGRMASLIWIDEKE